MSDDDASAGDRHPALAELSIGLQTAFDEAWTSWRSGNFGVGAALVDPATGLVVSVGRNRVAQSTPDPGRLSGNMTAHAEMNAFASLDRPNASGLHLYSTLQPCLMCAATTMAMKVDSVTFAAADEFYAGLDDLWRHHPVTASRQPTTQGPLGGRLARFARLLPMTFTLEHLPRNSSASLARSEHPVLAALADRMVADGAIRLRRLDTVDEALGAVWERLPTD